ncbi:Mis6-domain-containing protein [Dichotomocladium elegans]|nr:Mis6-domain-containing protein [Dichotomocladium elegans]
MSESKSILEDEISVHRSQDEHLIAAITVDDVNITNVDLFLQKELNNYSSFLPKSTLLRTFRQDFDTLKKIINTYGLNEDQLKVLLDLATSQKCAMNFANSVISCLLPRERVPSKCIVQIFGKLSDREFSPKLMASLLNWVLVIYDYVDSVEDISKFYPVLFHYLTMETLRPQICHLLYYMTKRAHVRPYRVAKLLHLYEKSGEDTSIYALLTVYATYDPSITLPKKPSRRKWHFSIPNPEMRNTIKKIQSDWETEEIQTEITRRPDMEDSTIKKRRVNLNMAAAIPSSQNIARSLDSTTISDIHTVVQLAESIDRLELPDQIASILGNRLLQHLVICDSNEITLARLNLWLSDTLISLIAPAQRSDVYRKSFQDILSKLIAMARLSRVHFPAVESFLARYISTWNGFDFCDEIFEMLTYIRPLAFEQLDEFLKALYRLFCISDVKWKARLILCYTEWVKNFILVDWYSHGQRRKDMAFDSDVDDMVWLFKGLDFNVEYFSTMHQFIQHVDRISALGLVIEGDHPLLQHATLSFFEVVSSMSLDHNIPEIIIPAAPVVYRSFFSSSGMAVSRICGIISRYKMAFEENDNKTGDWFATHSSEYLDNFNTYMMDICSSLWSNVLYKRENPEYLPFSLSTGIYDTYNAIMESRNQSLELALSLTHAASLSGFSYRFLNASTNRTNLSTDVYLIS